MNGEAIITVSAAVVAATQLVKWAGIPSQRGPWAVVGLALLGVLLWAVSEVRAWDRALIWPLFSGWIAVATSAAGVFGFVRAAPEAVSSFTTPPGGAGSSPVVEDSNPNPPFPIMHRGHAALLALVAPDPDAELSMNEARNLDGSPVDPDAPVVCGTCGAELLGLVADGKTWQAVAKGRSTQEAR